MIGDWQLGLDGGDISNHSMLSFQDLWRGWGGRGWRGWTDIFTLITAGRDLSVSSSYSGDVKVALIRRWQPSPSFRPLRPPLLKAAGVLRPPSRGGAELAAEAEMAKRFVLGGGVNRPCAPSAPQQRLCSAPFAPRVHVAHLGISRRGRAAPLLQSRARG